MAGRKVKQAATRLLVVLGLLLGGSHAAWALKPDRVYRYTPDSLGLAYTARLLKTPDGASLNTWTYVPDAQANKHVTIVLAYQDAGNMSNFLYHAKALSAAGYQVVTFDYRGFGHSSDFALNPSQLYYAEFAEDLRTVLKAARQQFPTHRLGVLSLSMGTIIASMVATDQKLDFLIGEGFVTSPAQFVARVKQAKGKDIVLPAQAGQYPALLPKVKCPLLVLVGSQDAFTTLADSRQLVQQGRHRELVEFAGSHLGGFPTLTSKPEDFTTFGDLYVARISAFLTKEGVLKS
ncbi:alpha/beta hydrolase [Hymenobacter lucidus]|uniref:Alpha/beta hydrolase n=1 Tax=Hymenobacter lucidus TaxID=2880930 RepID=A0ABS8AS83_9BACT|nr:alpha/beta fold hydrolase [Hymenobacter lucidus]MCB2409087.1 alpha/beta hydrolase [Hymenobacter lucidus]